MRRGSGPRRWLPPIALASAIVVLDQLTKALIRGWLPDRSEGPRRDLFQDWLGLDYVENRGAAFGSLAGFGVLLTVIAVVIVVVTLTIYARVPVPTRWLQAGLGLLIGGAIGNVIDRVSHGYVVDFIAVGPWPRFNVADSAITVGVLLLTWRLSGDEYATAPRKPDDTGPAVSGSRTSDDRTPSARTNGK